MKMVECECSLFIVNFCYIYFQWNREIGHLLTKISNFVQCSNGKHLLQCKAKYDDETIEI